MSCPCSQHLLCDHVMADPQSSACRLFFFLSRLFASSSFLALAFLRFPVDAASADITPSSPCVAVVSCSAPPSLDTVSLFAFFVFLSFSPLPFFLSFVRCLKSWSTVSAASPSTSPLASHGSISVACRLSFFAFPFSKAPPPSAAMTASVLLPPSLLAFFSLSRARWSGVLFSSASISSNLAFCFAADSSLARQTSSSSSNSFTLHFTSTLRPMGFPNSSVYFSESLRAILVLKSMDA
mmetsp:Transcript_17906/g.42626  ORF Transcript_17906/g.42626 Transcript_17906/m.42626 type:complete len:238 (-) Transcript_17906:890-1603(-)